MQIKRPLCDGGCAAEAIIINAKHKRSYYVIARSDKRENQTGETSF
jgi:hypothetical protein